jgi:crossover junction endodeoxyribonuclease RusA
MIEITLPWPPSYNNYYRIAGKRLIIAKDGKRFRRAASLIAAYQKVTTFEGAVHVEIDLHPPDNRRRDCDNYQKIICDALQHGQVYKDDSQIVKLTTEKKEKIPDGRVIVRVYENKENERG